MIQQHVLFKRNGLHGLPFSFMTRSGKPRLSYRNLCCFPHSLDFYKSCGRFFYHLWWHQRHLVWGHYGQIMVSKSTFFTSSCLWSFDKIFTIWTIGFIIHLVQDYLQPSTELGDIHEELKNGCVHYDTTTCSIQEKWFTWLTVFLYDKIWKTTFKLPESLLFPALTWFLQELWQVLLPFMVSSKTPGLRSLWTNYGIKVMECFIFAETLYS